MRTDFRRHAIDGNGADDNAGWSRLTIGAQEVSARSLASVDGLKGGGGRHEVVFVPAWPYSLAAVAQHVPVVGTIVRRGAVSKYQKKDKKAVA